MHYGYTYTVLRTRLSGRTREPVFPRKFSEPTAALVTRPHLTSTTYFVLYSTSAPLKRLKIFITFPRRFLSTSGITIVYLRYYPLTGVSHRSYTNIHHTPLDKLAPQHIKYRNKASNLPTNERTDEPTAQNGLRSPNVKGDRQGEDSLHHQHSRRNSNPTEEVHEAV